MSCAVIFPEGRIEVKHLKNLCALFDVIHIAMPWAMEPTPEMKEAAKLGVLEIHRPNDKLCLDTELKAVLKQCEHLARSVREGDLSSFIKAALLTQREESRWEISQAIKEMDGTRSDTKDGDTQNEKGFYHQILLHLYQKTQDNRKEVEGNLGLLELSKSPLADAIEDDEPYASANMDLGPEELEVVWGSATLGEILKAWIGLFSYLPRAAGVIVTVNDDVFNLIAEQFEEIINKDIISAKPLDIINTSLISCTTLPLQRLCSDQTANIRQKAKELFSLLSDSLVDTTQQFPQVVELLNTNIEKALGQQQVETYQLLLCKLPRPGVNQVEKNGLYQLLSGKLVANIACS